MRGHRQVPWAAVTGPVTDGTPSSSSSAPNSTFGLRPTWAPQPHKDPSTPARQTGTRAPLPNLGVRSGDPSYRSPSGHGSSRLRPAQAALRDLPRPRPAGHTPRGAHRKPQPQAPPLTAPPCGREERAQPAGLACEVKCPRTLRTVLGAPRPRRIEGAEETETDQMAMQRQLQMDGEGTGPAQGTGSAPKPTQLTTRFKGSLLADPRNETRGR